MANQWNKNKNKNKKKKKEKRKKETEWLTSSFVLLCINKMEV